MRYIVRSDYDHSLFERKEWRPTSKVWCLAWVFLYISTKTSIRTKKEKKDRCQVESLRGREEKL